MSRTVAGAHFMWCVALLAIGLLLGGPGGRAGALEYTTKDHGKSIAAQLLREGKADEAAELLLVMHGDFPDDKRILFDLVAALSWADRHKEAAALAGDYLEIRPPRYSLAAAAASFRRIGDTGMAIKLYEDGQKRYPDDPDFVIGHIVTLVDAGRYDEAAGLAGDVRRRHGESKELAEAEAYLRAQRLNVEFRRRRDDAARLAREEKFDQALAELADLKRDRPDAAEIDYDRLTVLSWAGRHAEAAALAGSVHLAEAPDYVRRAAAVSFREAGDFARSVEMFRSLLDADPDNYEMAEGLVVTLIRAGRLDEAEHLVLGFKSAEHPERMAAAEREIVALRRDEAVNLAAAGDVGAALERLYRLRQTFPGHIGVLHDIAAVLSWAGRHDEAVRQADAFDVGAAPDYVRRAAAHSYRETGRYTEAEWLYRKLLADHPDDRDLIEGLALTLLADRRLDEAERVIDRYKPAHPDGLARVEAQLVALRRDEATALARAGRHDEALALLDRLRLARPGYVGIDYDRLMILSWAGRHAEAAALAEQVDVWTAPDYVRLAAATSFRAVGENAPAERLYRGLLEANPGNHVMAEGLALTLIQDHRPREAQSIIDRFRTPADPDALPDAERALVASLRDLAVGLGRSERYEAAISELEILRRRHPEHAGLMHDELAIMFWAGRYDEVARLGAGLDPAAVPVYTAEAVAGSLRRVGRLEAAFDFYRRAAMRYPDSPDLAVGLAMTLHELGMTVDGLRVLDAFETRRPGDPDGKIADARRYLSPPEPYTPPPRPDAPYRRLQDDIVAMARDGKAEGALAEMEKLRAEHPDDVYLLGDYIVLLHWAKDNETALALVPRLDLRLVHDYVVVMVMRSLMTIGNHYRAQVFLDEAIEAQDGNAELMAAGAVPIAWGGDMEKAIAYLDRAAASRWPGIGNRVAEAKEAIGYNLFEDIANLEDSNRAEARSGETPDTERRKTEALLRVRASRFGRERMAASPELLLSADHRRAAKFASASQTAVWGEQTVLPRDLNAHNHYFMDAIRQLDELRLDPECESNVECRVMVGAAKVRALYEMNMACLAIAEYEAIKDLGVPVPDGALLAAAGAYLGARYPAKAKCVYLEVLARADGPNPPIRDDVFEAKKGLYWALLENEELEAALWRAELDFREGTGQDGKTPIYDDEDWRKTDLHLTRGLANLYTGFFARAEGHLTAMTEEVPGHSGALAGLASTYAMRGLPRTANDAVHLAQIHDPSDIGLAAQEATNALNYQDWRKTAEILPAVRPYRDQVNAVDQLERDWATHNAHELRVDVAGSRVTSGGGPNEGSGVSPTVEARLFSKPFLCDWRVFVGAGTSSGDFDEGHARQTIYMTGLEFRNPMLTATLEVRADRVNDYDFGLGLSGAVTPGDHWSFPFSFEIGSRDTPLRARYNDITANAASVGASYSWNESRSVNATIAAMDFSDDNRRYSFGGDFNQRLWTCYNHYIDGQINAYTSYNSEDADRPYFNPKHDFELGLAFTYGNLLWRCYDRSFSHALTVGAGNYYQKHYGSDLVWSVSYSQSLDWTDRFSLSYGVGYGRRVYDGDPEKVLNAWLSAVYKF